MKSDYYVYLFYGEDWVPYYVGLSQRNNRIKENLGRGCPLPPMERRIKVQEGLTKQEGMELETFLIKFFGIKEEGGTLYNKVYSFSEPSDKTRKLMSEVHKGQVPHNKGVKFSPEKLKEHKENRLRRYGKWFLIHNPQGISWCEFNTMKGLSDTYSLGQKEVKQGRCKGFTIEKLDQPSPVW